MRSKRATTADHVEAFDVDDGLEQELPPIENDDAMSVATVDLDVDVGDNVAQEASGPPKDRCSLTYISFMTLGIGILFPFDSILQSSGLFTSTLMFGGCSDIIFVATAANTAGTLGFMVLLVILNSRFNCNSRVFAGAGFLSYAVLIAAFAIGGTSLSYAVCVVLMFLLGVAGAFVQSAIFGLSAMLPPRYTAVTMFGNGFCGTLLRDFLSLIHTIGCCVYGIASDD